jgi:hypothetical protein
MIGNPELQRWVKQHSDNLVGGWGNLVVLAVKFHIGAGMELARSAQGEVKI